METIEQQVKFRHKLAYYAGLNYTEYERLQTICFTKYCERIRAHYFIDLKTLTTNDYLRNWYDSQWQYWVEERIKQRYNAELDKGILDEVDVVELIYLHQEEIEYYPEVLLKMIQKKETIKIVTI